MLPYQPQYLARGSHDTHKCDNIHSTCLTRRSCCHNACCRTCQLLRCRHWYRTRCTSYGSRHRLHTSRYGYSSPLQLTEARNAVSTPHKMSGHCSWRLSCRLGTWDTGSGPKCMSHRGTGCWPCTRHQSHPWPNMSSCKHQHMVWAKPISRVAVTPERFWFSAMYDFCEQCGRRHTPQHACRVAVTCATLIFPPTCP